MAQKQLSETEIHDLLRMKLKKLGKRFNPSISEVELSGFVSETMSTIKDNMILVRCKTIGGG